MCAKPGTLWIGDLDAHMDEYFLKQAFAMAGENLLQAKIIKNKVTGLPMGYGFLEFGDEQTAQKVLHTCNGKVIPNAHPPKRFKLNHASYGKEHLQTKEYSLFVGDLTQEVDDLTLYNAFSSKYPSVKTAKVVLDQSGASKGFGFVRFTNEDEYQKALVGMQNARHIGSKPIRVSIATPKRSIGVPSIPQEYSPFYHFPSYEYGYYQPAWQGYQQYYTYAFDPSTCATATATYDPNFLHSQQLLTPNWM